MKKKYTALFFLARETINLQTISAKWRIFWGIHGGLKESEPTGNILLRAMCLIKPIKKMVTDSVRPLEIKIPAVKGKSLINLKIGRSELKTPQLQKLIKSAYRAQAKKHHPDIGGNTAAFRKIHQAYEELISWAESPTFVERHGFPDKWFYDGNKNRWVQPTPKPNIK